MISPNSVRKLFYLLVSSICNNMLLESAACFRECFLRCYFGCISLITDFYLFAIFLHRPHILKALFEIKSHRDGLNLNRIEVRRAIFSQGAISQKDFLLDTHNSFEALNFLEQLISQLVFSNNVTGTGQATQRTVCSAVAVKEVLEIDGLPCCSTLYQFCFCLTFYQFQFPKRFTFHCW